MLQQDSINKVMVFNPIINKNKLDKIEIALEKIARKNGEDEYYAISSLIDKKIIEIENKEIRELRNRYIWLWINSPYNKDVHSNLKKKINKYNLSELEYIRIITKNNKKYIRYAEKIEVCGVYKDIFEILKDEHDIYSDFLKGFEWEQIQGTSKWNDAEIQIARELIAEKKLNSKE